jgi:hypothetical protein
VIWVSSIIFYALQQSLASHGTWYLIALGLVAMAYWPSPVTS